MHKFVAIQRMISFSRIKKCTIQLPLKEGENQKNFTNFATIKAKVYYYHRIAFIIYLD